MLEARNFPCLYFLLILQNCKEIDIKLRFKLFVISLDGETAHCFTGTACEENEGKMSHQHPLCLTLSGGTSALRAL